MGYNLTEQNTIGFDFYHFQFLTPTYYPNKDFHPFMYETNSFFFFLFSSLFYFISSGGV